MRRSRLLVLAAAATVIWAGAAACATGEPEGSTPPSPQSTVTTASPTQSTTHTIRADDLAKAALRGRDLGSGWTASDLPTDTLNDPSGNPCLRRYQTDAMQTAVYGVVLTPSDGHAELAESLAAYQPRGAHAAIAEIRSVARACPRYTKRSSEGLKLRITVVVSQQPPAVGDERVVVNRRVDSSAGSLYSVLIAFRTADVVATISSVAGTPQLAGELAGRAAAAAETRLKELPSSR